MMQTADMIRVAEIPSDQSLKDVNTTSQTENETNDSQTDNDGIWLLITSTVGVTLGYVRIDDHDHQLRMAEIRAMIKDKLSNNTEYFHGWNFGSGFPLKIVAESDETNIFAKDLLPSVSVVSAHSAQHILNTNNPISAATAMQYGLSPMNLGFPQSANTANIQPLPMSSIFTPIQHLQSDISIHKMHQMNAMYTGSEQFYPNMIPNTVTLLQPHTATEQTEQSNNESALSATAPPLESSNSNRSSNAQIPSLPPFSPPTLTPQELEQKSKLQKQKLQNLLPQKHGNSPKASNNKKNGDKKPSLPRLKPIGNDGKVIETEQKQSVSPKKKSAMPDPISQKNMYCQDCDKKFENGRGYRSHMKKAHSVKVSRGRNKERRFVCAESGCSKSFYQSSDLRRHQRVHLKIKPFKCSACLKEFTQRGSLYRHIKGSHKGKDPKSLIILQTQQTLPESGQKKAVQKEVVSNADQNNDLPPEVTVPQNNNDLPPPLTPIDNDVVMQEKSN